MVLLPYIGGNTTGIIDSFDGGTPSSVYGNIPGIIDAGGVL